MECAILFKTKKDGLISIPVKNYSNEYVINALAEYSDIEANKFQCLASSMSYGIYGLKEQIKGFPIKKWTAPDFADYKHTFTIQYIRTL
jgi:hypothetical protein